MVQDTTRAAWSVTIPALFHISFWFIPSQMTTCVIWRATGPDGLLLVGYDANTRVFFLEDHLSRQVTVSFAIEAQDRICIGVCQTISERRLFVASMGGDVESGNVAIAPVGQLTSLQLY